jgi:hypothetical protein
MLPGEPLREWTMHPGLLPGSRGAVPARQRLLRPVRLPVQRRPRCVRPGLPNRGDAVRRLERRLLRRNGLRSAQPHRRLRTTLIVEQARGMVQIFSHLLLHRRADRSAARDGGYGDRVHSRTAGTHDGRACDPVSRTCERFTSEVGSLASDCLPQAAPPHPWMRRGRLRQRERPSRRLAAPRRSAGVRGGTDSSAGPSAGSPRRRPTRHVPLRRAALESRSSSGWLRP